MRAAAGIRIVLIGLAAVLAVVLISRGNVLIGGLIGAMAIARAAMFASMQKRRSELRSRIAARRAPRDADAGRAWQPRD